MGYTQKARADAILKITIAILGNPEAYKEVRELTKLEGRGEMSANLAIIADNILTEIEKIVIYTGE